MKDKKQQEEALIKEIDDTKSRMSEVNEELSLITSELQNAGIDNHEGKRQRKRAEVLEHLKRLYPDSVVIRIIVHFKAYAFSFLKIVFLLEIENITF